MRNQTIWKDHVVDQNGEIIQQGTPQSAGNFNNLERDVTDQEIAFKEVLQHVRLLEHDKDIVKANTLEEYSVITLTNTAKQPFNNSEQTVPLKTTRNNTMYTVTAEILNNNGLPGDISIYDKQLNGFKVAFTGSASTVQVALIIKGGIKE